MNRGLLYAFTAYAWWGFFPLYWKLLQKVPALQLIGHRIIWSFISLLVVILILKQWKSFRESIFVFKTFRIYLLAAILIGVNWFLYVWAVNAGYIVETSLGYFINPLISVMLGVLFFKEKLKLWQWIPIALAGAGVLYMTISIGQLQWIALILAFSFGFYGMIKKIAPLSSLQGLTLETVILLVPALAYLIHSENSGVGAFFHQGLFTDFLIVLAGIITTIPLLLFASATKRIPLSYIGIMQYLAPTIQFLIGIFVFNESFSVNQFIGFLAVWIALIIFGLNSFKSYREKSVSPFEMD